MSQLQAVLTEHLDFPGAPAFGATAGVWAGGRELLEAHDGVFRAALNVAEPNR